MTETEKTTLAKSHSIEKSIEKCLTTKQRITNKKHHLLCLLFYSLSLALIIFERGAANVVIDMSGNDQQQCQDGVCHSEMGHDGIVAGDPGDDNDGGQEQRDLEETTKDGCVDESEMCGFWAKHGECDANPNYMLVHCRLSCDNCSTDSSTSESDSNLDPDSFEKVECIDSDDHCSDWAKNERCEKNLKVMANLCKKSCGLCSDKFDTGALQKIPNADNSDSLKILTLIHESHAYYHNSVEHNTTLSKIKAGCLNRHEQCAEWAEMGECDANPKYMKIKCALACQSCEMLELSIRCPHDPNEPEALAKGDLNRLFERVLSEEKFQEYQPRALSRPYHPVDENKMDGSYIIGPWVLSFDNFLTEDECTHLINQGHEKGYERSTGVGELQFDGTNKAVKSEGRTSTNAWCTDSCYNTTLTKSVLKRLETVTGVPETNGEYLQLLRYEPGQFYSSHHDYLENDLNYPWGPRVLTFYLYLNDVEKGGGTKFTDLDLVVTPKRGSAILWPSVIDEDPLGIEARTNHAALTVEEGVKYGANAWIHLRDFKRHHDSGCA